MDHPTQRLNSDEATATPEHPTRHLDTPQAIPGRTCPKCSGEMIWAGVRDTLRGGATSLGIEFTRPKQSAGLLEPKVNVSRCGAKVCIICGFAEFYATQPKDLLGDSR